MRVLATALLLGALLAPQPAQAQTAQDRVVEQYLCKDVMRESGANRDVAIAFLHGFLLGKSGSSAFNLDQLRKQSDEFIEACLDKANEKAVDVMSAVKRPAGR
jgi:hypothetical protein